jgi:chromosome segregation ATPase
MIHCRLKKETRERLNKAKSRSHKTSHDAIINKALDVFDGKEIRKLEQRINELTRKNNDLEAVNLERREDYRKVIEEKKPLEDQNQKFNEELEKKNGELKAKDKEHQRELANIKNELQIKGQEIASLEIDIEHWKTKLQEMSKDTVLEENQYLKVELGKKDMEIEAKNERIVEVENLIKMASSQKEDIINTVLKMLRDCKQFIPSMPDGCKQCVDASSLEQYGKNVLKSISNLEGYLNTCKNHAS